MLGRWTQILLRHRLLVLGVWALVIVGAALVGPHVNSRLVALTDVPGSSSALADQVLAEEFQENSDGSFLVTVKFVQATDAQIESFKSAVAASAASVPSARVLQQRAVGGTLYAYLGTSLTLSEAANYTDDLRAALSENGLATAQVSGTPALEFDVRPTLSRDLALGAVLALTLALAILLLLLGFSIVVFVPFIVAGATVAAGLVCLYLLAGIVPMVLYTPNVVELLSLGLAIDYSLLVIQRLRSEVGAGKGHAHALQTTMESAGRTVLFSGITVALSLATLVLVPVPFIRSLGLAGVLVPSLSLMTALTLKPVLLSFAEGRLVSQRMPGLLAQQSDQSLWPRLARWVIRRPALVLGCCSVVLVLATVPVIDVRVAPASLTAVPKTLESARALEDLTKRVGAGVITPHVLMIDTGVVAGALTEQSMVARTRLADALGSREDVSTVAHDAVTPFIDEDGQFLRVFVVGRAGFGEDDARTLVEALRGLNPRSFGFPDEATFTVGGASARGVDFVSTIYSSLPITVALVILLSLLVMLAAFRSVLLPIKAVALNVVSVLATLGIVVAVFEWVLNTARLELWALVLLFATLFGLSMDYHVFVVTRIREEWLKTGDNSQAIAVGMASTGTVISGAALIFVSALSGFIFGSIPGLTQFGLGLALGVILDATIIRGLLVPSAMVLFGKWNWWLPSTFGQGDKDAVRTHVHT